MSRNIDWEQPLSDEDRAWAEQFHINRARIALNDEQHGGSGDADADDEVPPYEEWSKKDLLAEINRRPSTSAPSGNPKQADLVAILQADDDAEAAKTK
jgi:hypothetical protein